MKKYWLFLLLGFLFLLRIPSFFEPYSYVDEVIYLTLGSGVRQGLILYKDIFDHKTPLIYLLAALANGDQIWFKFIFNAWMLATVALFYKLVQKMFPKYKGIQIVSTVCFGIFTTLRLFEGLTVNSEALMLAPTLAAVLLVFPKKEKTNFRNYFFAGICMSLAMHFKVPAAFDMGAILFLLFVSYKFKSFFAKAFLLIIGFLVPTILFALLFWLQGALGDYINTAFLFNFGYITAFRPDDVQKPFLVRNAPLLTRAFVSAIGIVVLWFIRKKVSKPFLFASALLITSLFAITLSERPYPHYIIQMLPSVSILLGILVASPKYEQALSVIPLFVAFLVPVVLNTWHYPNRNYYQRFVNFATNRIDKTEYFNQYDTKVNRNYQISRYIRERTAPNARIFVWGPDAPVIYALTKRMPPTKYVTSFHIQDLPDKSGVINDLNRLPSFIIVTPEYSDFGELFDFIHSKYKLMHTIDGADIYRLDNLTAKLKQT